MEWTEETISRLRALWQEGLSTAEIGRQLAITKNAVVGKAHRLGLPPRPSPIRRQTEGDQKPVRAEAKPAKPQATPAPAAVEEALSVPPVAAEPEAVSTPVAVIESVPEVVQQAESTTPNAGPAVTQPEEPKTAIVEPQPVRQPEPVVAVQPKTPTPPVKAPAPAAEPAQVAPRPSLRAVSTPPVRRTGLTCCWPLGEPGTKAFHFCGATPLPGKPYCAEHAQLAYVKLRDRRDNVA